MTHQLPNLSYGYTDMEPYIDAATMHLHHEKHHAAYVKNLNEALEKHRELQSQTAEELLRNLASIPEDIRAKVRNNGGGHVNHSMFWRIMKPQGAGRPVGAIAEAITRDFGDFEDFRKQFETAGVHHFGSGWVWLVAKNHGKMQVVTTANQDNPISQGLYPIMGNDLWEHAYYLKYNNRRGEYLAAWWNVVNWAEVNVRYEALHAAHEPAFAHR